MKQGNIYILILIFFCTISLSWAQNEENPFSIEFGGTQIDINEPFVISVKVAGIDPMPLISFPDNIKNFQKRESSRSSFTNKVGGKTIVTYTISQNYYPIKTGIFSTGPLEILINKQVLRSEGTSIIVGKTDQLEDTKIETFKDIHTEPAKEATTGAFLSVRVDKRSVYVEEGFNLRLSLIVSESNATEMDFFDVEKQLEQILKVLKPANCWEENFGIQEIPAIPIKIKGKAFTEYRIYQASFFPFNNQAIWIPAVTFLMKVLPKNDTNEKAPSYLSFLSRPTSVQVKSLPAHPLRNQVLVGNFQLEEKISTTQLETGKSYHYDFKIIGDGNIKSIQEPVFTNKALFDVYPPDVEDSILRKKGKITGKKTFHYQIIPKQNGAFDLNNNVFWVFFNPQKQKYDTLRSTLKLVITGKNIQNTQLAGETVESIYNGIEHWDTTKFVFDYQKIIRNVANVLVIIMLLSMILIFRK
jgi:hypothetical protein